MPERIAVNDGDEELGWRDPMVVLGAIVLVGVIVWLIVSIATGHSPFHRDTRSSTPSTSRTVIPSAPSGSVRADAARICVGGI